MSLATLLVLIVLPLLNAVVSVTPAVAATPHAAAATGTSQLLVQFTTTASAVDIAAAVSSVNGTDVKTLSDIQTHEVDVLAGTEASAIATLQANPVVTNAAQEVTMRTASIPNDPGYSKQWALPKISWDGAYGSINPSGSATIAVLDTGVDASHPDLSGVVSSANSISEVGGNPTSDANGHGTEMAGIAAASVNNNTGMAGVDYAGARVSSVQVLGSDGTGTDANVTAGVLWAADHGANVILMSLYSTGYSDSLANAIVYAQNKGVLVVAATGNSASGVRTYPAGDPGVLGVASTDQNDNVLTSSDLVSADVAAPGQGIYSTQPGGGYGFVSGTSPAAAEVAGLAGLLIANGSGATQAYSQITGATDPISGQPFGRINVLKALGGPPVTVTPQPTVSATPDPVPSPTYVTASNMTVQGSVFSAATGGGLNNVAVKCLNCNSGSNTSTSTATGAYPSFTVQFGSQSNLQFCAQPPAGSGFNSQVVSVQGPKGNSTYSLDFHLSSGTDPTPCATPSGTGTPTKLVFVPSAGQSIVAGQTSSAISVELQDANGNPVAPQTQMTVNLSPSPTGGTLSATTLTIPTTSPDSTATFTYTDKNVRSVTITGASTTTGVCTSTCASATQTETITPILTFTQQPTNTAAGSSITPAVTVTAKDANTPANTVTTYTGSVTVAIANNAGGGTLSGTTTVNAVSGVATFSSLSIDKAGTGYTLSVSGTGTTSTATSSAFNITAGAVSAGTSTVVANPTSVPADGTTTSTVTVTLLDANSNPVSGKAVTLSQGTGSSTITTVTGTTGSDGQASFTVKDSKAETVTYTAKDTTDNVTITQTANVTFTSAISATNSTVVASPTAVPADGTTTSTITVTLLNASSSPVSGKTVTLAADSGSSIITTVSGTTNASGQATFTVKDSTAQSVTYTATDTTDSTVITQTAGVTFTASVLVFNTIGNTTAGATLNSGNVTVTAKDAAGNTVTGFTGNVTVVFGTNAGGGTLSGTLTAAATSGVATFNNLSINKAGTGYTLTASGSTTAGSISGTSNSFNIIAGTVSAGTSTVVANPTSVAADGTTTSTITVTLLDANSNPVSGKSVTLGQGAGSSTITTVTGTTGANGQASFTVKDTKAEVVTYSATDTTDSIAITQTAQVTFTPGAVAKLVFNTISNAASGASLNGGNVTVTAEDANNNVVTTYTGNITVAITAGTGASGATLGGTTTQPAASGVATFNNLSINKVGTGYTLSATGTGTSSTGTSNSFNITAGAVSAATSTVVANPTSVVADGSATSTITVTLLDAGSNPVSGKTVTLAQGSGHSTITSVTGTTGANGQAIFTVTDTKAETVTYTATDATDSITVTQTAQVSFTPGAVSAVKSIVVANPTSVVADGTTTSTITVTLLDANSNPVSGKTVSLGQGTGASTITTVTGTTGSNGQASFTAKDTKAETVTYTATDTTDSNLVIAQTAQVTFTPGTAAKLVFGQQPTDTTAGVSIAPAVTVLVEDANNNVVTNSTASVTLTLSSGTFAGGSTTASVSASSGVATFSGLVINKTGTYTLTASSGSLTGATSSSFTINPAAASKLVFSRQPSNAVAGVAIAPAVTVQIQDQFGNVVTTDSTDAVTVAIGTDPGGGTLSGTKTVIVSSGVATFSTLSINKAGNGYTLTASSGSLVGATSNTFNITPAAAAGFTVSGYASPTVAGTSHSFSVTALDAFGNVATGYVGTVHFTSTDGAASLPADYAFTGPDAGLHSFSATFNTVGTQSLTATDTATSSITGSQTGIVVRSVPNAPVIGTPTAGNGFVTVVWNAPSDNGSAILSYTITPYINGVAGTPVTYFPSSSPSYSCSASCSATFGSLQNGTTYTFTVYATNGIGNGPPSAHSAPVIPTVGLCSGSAASSLALCGVSVGSFGSITLNGHDQQTYAQLSSFNVQDQQINGGNTGWKVLIQASQLKCTSADSGCPAAGDTMTANRLFMAGPLPAGSGGSVCVSGCSSGSLVTPQGNTPFAIDTGDTSGSAVKIADYTGGDASYTLVPGSLDGNGDNLQLTVPASAYTTTYHTTVTVTVASGPS